MQGREMLFQGAWPWGSEGLLHGCLKLAHQQPGRLLLCRPC